VFSKRCDAELGDSRCTKDISTAASTFQANVLQVLDEAQFSVVSLNAPQNDWFSAGTITWIDGQNAGLTARISQYFQNGAEDVFTLAALPIKPIAVGDVMSIAAGCNKSLDHCTMKFSNVLHFRGCPFMPGNDSLIAGPVQSR